VAQTPQSRPQIPDGGTREVLVSIFIPSSANAPFTATVNTEWLRPLADGTRITLTNHRMIARDNSGRIFQERRMLVPENGQVESFVTQIEISDPVAQELYICKPRERTCQLEPFQPAETRFPGMGGRTVQASGNSPAQEPLGTQFIGGLETVGTRETVMIPPGAIGNDGSILSKREYWYSEKLGLNLLSIRDDPRFGVQKFELSAISLGEPDKKLFAPPEGFKILDLRRPAELAAPSSNSQ
jgi:hypothetical protein